VLLARLGIADPYVVAPGFVESRRA